MQKFFLSFVAFALVACSEQTAASYPENSANYREVNSEVGCKSKFSDAKKDDIFERSYKDHWMTWKGVVVLSDADDADLDMDSTGIQDLHVSFADKRAGYNLQKGQVISVRFLMKMAGGCFLPFSGEDASIVP